MKGKISWLSGQEKENKGEKKEEKKEKETKKKKKEKKKEERKRQTKLQREFIFLHFIRMLRTIQLCYEKSLL